MSSVLAGTTSVSSATRAQCREQRVGRAPAVAQAVLLILGKLRERLAFRRIEKHRIVTEAEASHLLAGNHAFDLAVTAELFAALHDQDHRAAELRRPLLRRNVRKFFEQFFAPLRPGDVFAAVPRRQNSRTAAER